MPKFDRLYVAKEIIYFYLLEELELEIVLDGLRSKLVFVVWGFFGLALIFFL
jgi:hypothetical protein